MVAFPPQGTGGGNTLSKGGSATIPANTNSVTVAHGLTGTPTTVEITPTNNFASQGATVINKTPTTFDIAFAFGVTQPSPATFDWRAVL